MIELVHRFTLPAAYAVLPEAMATDEASAFLLAAGLQESEFKKRRQVRGPAHSFWQFERTGVSGVVRHPATKAHVVDVLRTLAYGTPTDRTQKCYAAIGDNDVLACALARLLLWTLPQPLPNRDDPDGAWAQYLEAWRPGKPKRQTWASNYAQAWELVMPTGATIRSSSPINRSSI